MQEINPAISENIGRYNVIFEILSKQQSDIDEIKKKATKLKGVFQTAKGAFAGIIATNVVQSAHNGIRSIIIVTNIINSSQPAYFGRSGNENDQTTFFARLRKELPGWSI